jgi:hypothetical protein
MYALACPWSCESMHSGSPGLPARFGGIRIGGIRIGIDSITIGWQGGVPTHALVVLELEPETRVVPGSSSLVSPFTTAKEPVRVLTLEDSGGIMGSSCKTVGESGSPLCTIRANSVVCVGGCCASVSKARPGF